MLFPFFFKRSFDYNLLILLFTGLFILILNQVKIVSGGYYLVGVFILFNKFSISENILKFLLKGVLFFLLFTVIIDLISPSIIDNIIFFDRRSLIDKRLSLNFIRPVGFFRESSGLGITLAILLAIDLKYKFNNYRLIVLTGLLSLSSSFILLSGIIGFVYKKNIFKKPIVLVPFIILTSIIVVPRAIVIYNSFTIDIDVLMQIPLSFVKRFIHPFYGFYETITSHTIFNFFLGLGPGNYKEFLIKEFFWLRGSDLKVGYILNILLNFFLSFGFIYTSLILFFIKKQTNKNSFWIIILVLSQGIPLIHPGIFLLTFLYKNKNE
tara:strand:- start:7173 stop:8141 length:969 start_codon:yes stop_codon:yes gene_type:complete